jgi:adenylate cyclase
MPAAERRLAAILSADIAGYSRMIAADEEHTVRTLAAWREQVAALVREHRGRLADFTGDNFLAEFPTALDAVSCALETQRVLAARNTALPEDRRLRFRMGVHLGDVRIEGERLFGTGVNVAARLQTLAEPGGICLSDVVRSEVATRLGLALEDLGPRELKNLPEPVHAFRVRATDGAAGGARARPRRRLRVVLAAILGSIVLLATAFYLSWPRPLGLVLDLAGIGGPLVNPPLPDKPSLVVLPFQNLSNDPDQEYFSDGITEDLTTDLSRMRSVFVISRSSAFTYKGKAVRAPDVGRELGVRYVVEGSVRKAGDTVRVTAQLIDATNGHHVWSERYDRKLADIFALQTELVDDIVTQLPRQIRAAETQRARRKPPGDLSAYDAMLRGQASISLITRAGNEDARKWFERALELDPSYADAAAMLAHTYVMPYLQLWSLAPAPLERVRELGRRALALDPQSPTANQVLGFAAFATGQFEEALRYHERAVELDPSLAAGHFALAIDLLRLGRFQEALPAVQRSIRLDPLNIAGQGILAAVQLAAGRTEEAEALAQQVRAANPDLIPPRLLLANLYASQERLAEAQTLVAEIRAINPELTAEQASARMPFAGRSAETIARLRSAGLP